MNFRDWSADQLGYIINSTKRVFIITQSFRCILGIFHDTTVIISHYRRYRDYILFLNVKHEVVGIVLGYIISHTQNGGEIIFELSVVESFDILIFEIRICLEEMIQARFEFLELANVF